MIRHQLRRDPIDLEPFCWSCLMIYSVPSARNARQKSQIADPQEVGLVYEPSSYQPLHSQSSSPIISDIIQWTEGKIYGYSPKMWENPHGFRWRFSHKSIESSYPDSPGPQATQMTEVDVRSRYIIYSDIIFININDISWLSNKTPSFLVKTSQILLKSACLLEKISQFLVKSACVLVKTSQFLGNFCSASLAMEKALQ